MEENSEQASSTAEPKVAGVKDFPSNFSRPGQRECPWTIALCVASMVFGLISVFWAMIPCLGWTSLLVSIPASVAGLFAISRARNLGLPMTFPVAGLTVSVCGVLIAFINTLIFTFLLGWSL